MLKGRSGFNICQLGIILFSGQGHGRVNLDLRDYSLKVLTRVESDASFGDLGPPRGLRSLTIIFQILYKKYKTSSLLCCPRAPQARVSI